MKFVSKSKYLVLSKNGSLKGLKTPVLGLMVLIWMFGGSTTFGEEELPWIRVRPNIDLVQGFSWPVGLPIDLTIDGVSYGGGTTVDGSGEFSFELGGIFDIQQGDVVRATEEGGFFKELIVDSLEVTAVDVSENTVSGVADRDNPDDGGDSIDVSLWPDQGGCYLQLYLEGEEQNWSVDFDDLDELCDIVRGSGVTATRRDIDGDWTAVDLWLPMPFIRVRPNIDLVQGFSWPVGFSIDLTIDGVSHGGGTNADGSGEFSFELGADFDIQRGHVVVASDGETTKELIVAYLKVTNVDVNEDTVSGRADLDDPDDDGDTIDVSLLPDQPGCYLQVTADEDLKWFADFDESCDIGPGTGVAVTRMDIDGDWTAVDLWLQDPVDTDEDGIPDGLDLCLETEIPEGVVPTVKLNANHWALTEFGDPFNFDTVIKDNGMGPIRSYTIEDTAGCSCEQIIEAKGLGDGHTKFGCSISAMDDWVEFVNQ